MPEEPKGKISSSVNDPTQNKNSDKSREAVIDSKEPLVSVIDSIEPLISDK